MKKISLYFSLKIDVFEHQLFIIRACSPCLTRTTIKNRNVVKLSAQMPYFFVVRFIYFYFPLYQCRPPFFYSSYKSIQYIRLTESLCYLVKKAGIYKYILTLWLMLIYIGNYIFFVNVFCYLYNFSANPNIRNSQKWNRIYLGLNHKINRRMHRTPFFLFHK